MLIAITILLFGLLIIVGDIGVKISEIRDFCDEQAKFNAEIAERVFEKPQQVKNRAGRDLCGAVCEIKNQMR